MSYQKTVGALCAADTKQVGNQYVGQDKIVVEEYSKILRGGGIAATLDASYYKGPGARNGKEREFVAIDNEYMDQQNDSQTQPRRKYIVRRLTPTECLRLQGLPDWWCDGANGSDSAIYKMAGNGLAIPCAEDVIGRIVRAYERGW